MPAFLLFDCRKLLLRSEIVMATRKISYLARRLDAISIQSEAKAVKGKDKVFDKISQEDKGLNLL